MVKNPLINYWVQKILVGIWIILEEDQAPVYVYKISSQMKQ